jgi:putative lipoprotein
MASIAASDAMRHGHASLMSVHVWIGALAAASLVGCALAQPAADGAETYVYRCDGEAATVVVWLDGDRGHLFSRQASEPLRRQADGVTFAGTDVSYRPDRPPDLAPAQTAAISVAGKALQNCKNDPRAAVWEAAKLRGVSFRGVGQEPPWVLEIHRDNGFLLVTDYGESRHSFPYSEPVSDPQQRSARYRSQANGERIVITVTGESCRDSMSGESFASRVDIEWRERLLRGCGRPLH